jgi:hypothetical protein
LDIITLRVQVRTDDALDVASPCVVGEGSTSRESVAESKALGEILDVVVLSVGTSRKIIPTHDEVV